MALEITLIAAMDDNRLIGSAGQLPWRLPDDLKRFKSLTLDKTVLMGRKTWDSLGRPLPQRDNRVLTRDRGFSAAGAHVFHDLETAIRKPVGRELMVIGGAELYRQLMPQATCLQLTHVHTVLDGDAWFPSFDRSAWTEISREDRAADARHAHDFSFVTYRRR